MSHEHYVHVSVTFTQQKMWEQKKKKGIIIQQSYDEV